MSERTKLNDDDLMPFGKYVGQRLGDIPDDYWRWLIRQTWAVREHPDLVAYGQIAEQDAPES